MRSTNNQNIIPIQSTNKREITLASVKQALKRIIKDYEDAEQQTDLTFDIFEHLQNELGEGYAEPTVRKWLNPTNNDFPKLNQLVTISKHLKNRHAIDVAIAYLNNQAEGLN